MSEAASRLPRAVESVLATERGRATRRQMQQPPTTRTTTNAIQGIAAQNANHAAA